MSQVTRYWTELKASPIWVESTPFLTNDNEFLVLSHSMEFPPLTSIIHYNIKMNSWVKRFDFDEEFDYLSDDELYNWHTFTILDDTPLFYIVNNNQKLLELNLKTNTINTNTIEITPAPEAYGPLVCTHDKIHIINRYFHHLIFDIKSNKTIEMDVEPPCELFENPYLLLFMKSTNSILVFCDEDETHHCTVIYQVSLLNGEWTKWDMAIPSEHRISSAIFFNKTEDFLFFLGGDKLETQAVGPTDLISVYDIKQATFSACSIKCPQKEHWNGGITVQNEHNDELLVFGFIKELFSSSEFNDIPMMPRYLIQLIGTYVCNEFIHLIGSYHHWKINMVHILGSLN